MLKSTLAGLAVILLVLGGMTATAQTFSIQLDNTSFKVVGWNPPRATPAGGWASVFVIYAGTGDVPPLLGKYAVESGTLTFHPTFPFAPGVRYRAVFRPPGGGAAVEKIFNGPPRETVPQARVERVYPSSDVLPSNQLRIYIYFSAPMSRGEATARVHMLDENGKVLDDIFLPGSELWDRGGRRVTLTLDPGRIKRGLTSNERVGPPLTPGKRYTLLIDREWLDARTVPMVEGFRKTLRGGPADREAPDPKKWRLTPPRSGTVEPLIVDFPDPMNYPLLGRMLKVSTGRTTVDGTVGVERQETRWTLTPRQPWKAGAYQLASDIGLEDLAGNHIGELFDMDVFESVTEHITTGTTTLPFSVR